MARKARKSASWIVTLVVLSAMVAGAARAAKKVELTCWYFGGQPHEIEWIHELTDRFNAAHPNIKVTQTDFPWGERRTKVTTAFLAGELSDVFGIESGLQGDFFEMGMLEPLDETFPEILQWKERFVDIMWETMFVKEHIVSIPHNTNIHMFVAKKPAFAAAGLGDPVDEIKFLDDVLRVAKKMTVDRDGDGKIDQYGYDVDCSKGTVLAYFEDFVMNAGERFEHVDEGRMVLNSEAVLEIVKTYRSWQKAGVLPPGFLERGFIDVCRMYVQEIVPLVFLSSWFPGVAHGMGYEEWMRPEDVFVAAPKTRTSYGKFPQATLIASECWFMSSQSKHKKETWEYLKFMGSDEALLGWGANFKGRVPVNHATFRNPATKKMNPALVSLYEKGLLFEGLDIKMPILGRTQWEPMFSEAIQKGMLMDDDAKIQALLDELNEAANEIYSEIKGG